MQISTKKEITATLTLTFDELSALVEMVEAIPGQYCDAADFGLDVTPVQFQFLMKLGDELHSIIKLES
jgi:hypothetical protein